jgi:hypothetical protein
MQVSAAERIDALNIGLMLLSLLVAFFVPLELFLFSYMILGPLHYLTEISWLHDRKYFTKGRYDALLLVVIGLVSTLVTFSLSGIIALEFPRNSGAFLAYVALLSAAIFALVKSNYMRIIGLVLIVASAKISEHFVFFLTIFLPTLIHVYFFTGLFMLYGALKSKSRLGIVSVLALIICPIILSIVAPDYLPFGHSNYGMKVYYGDKGNGFIGIHVATLSSLFDIAPAAKTNKGMFWIDQTFNTRTGLLLLRFIAFAYTYHYLNWFSKTRVIHWHKVPRKRFVAVIIFWLLSIGLYLYNYQMGLVWLFFLSYLHVLLELPLNFTSIAGIGRYFQQRLFRVVVQKV